MICAAQISMNGVPPGPEAVRDRLAQAFDWKRVDPSVEGIEGSGILIYSSELASAEVNSQLDAMSQLPDHPDRHLLEFLAQLVASPLEERFSFGLARNGEWWIVQNRGGEPEFRAGCDGEFIWMLSSPTDGQLTAIGKGVRFPPTYNVDRRRTLLLTRISDIMGLCAIDMPSTAQFARSETAGWNAKWGSTTVSGIFESGGGILPLQLEIVGQCRMGASRTKWIWPKLGETQSHELLPHCKMHSYSRGDGVVETLAFHLLIPTTRSNVRVGVRMPNPNTARKFADYRTEMSAQRQRMAGGGVDPPNGQVMAVWSGADIESVSDPVAYETVAPSDILANASWSRPLMACIGIFFLFTGTYAIRRWIARKYSHVIGGGYDDRNE